MAFRKITEGDMLGKGNVGRPDTPGVSTAEMQRIMDELPREVLAPAFNELAGQLEAETAAADIGAAAPEGVTAAPAGKLQAVLNGLRDLVKAHTDRADNPHGVTAAQAGAYSKAETDAAISAKVVELGAGDMAKSIYDPGNEQQPLLPRNGDGSNVTASFTEAEQDADIASGEKLSVLFGKIKKRFSVVNKLVNGAVYPNLGTNTNFSNPINQRGAASYTTTTEASIYCIDRWRIVKNTTYTVASFTLTAPSYAARACGMWQSNEMGAHQLSIGDDVTVSIYANGKLHTPTMKVIDRDLYDAFANVPASYDCDDFEIVLCTYARDNTMYNLGIYPKKPLTVNYIKWEKGSVATPYVPKGYGAELSECLRYYYQVASVRTFGQQHTGAGTYVNIILPQVMRVTPTVSAPGEWTIRFNGMDKKATVSSVNSLTGNTLNLTMSTIAGGTYIGPLYAFYDGKITFSADL